MAGPAQAKAKLYKRYPLPNILTYNGATVLHFALGGAGIVVGYSFWGWASIALGAAYLAFAFGEMYVGMPLTVCPNCAYYRWQGSVCISGLNIIARRLAPAGNPYDFAGRARGPLCANNLYLASLATPILALIPATLVNFSWALPCILAALIGLLAFRVLVIFPKLACVHCQAKFACPQAGQMGLREL